MPINTREHFGEDPIGYAMSPEFSRLVLEKVRFGVKAYMSPAMLSELRMNPDYYAQQMAGQIAYQVEGMVFGREARERTIDRRTVKEKEEVKEPVIKTAERQRSFNKTWQDHLKDTLVSWAAKRSVKAEENAIEGHPDEDDPDYYRWRPRLGLRLRQWYWQKVFDLTSKMTGDIQKEIVEIAVTNVTNIRITPITKHIEVHKHWHTCPHLDIVARDAHLEFLADAGRFE